MKTPLAFLLSGMLCLTSCSMFSKSARQQKAYEKYVRKSSITRTKQQRSYFKTGKPQMPTSPMPSEPIQSSESGPQAVPREEAAPAQG